MNLPPVLTIVVPCFNEGLVLPFAIERTTSLLENLKLLGKIHSGSHMLFVDDGSTDNTWQVIKDGGAHSSAIRGIKLSANCGHQIALMAGLFSSTGDVVVTIDADLQDDVTAIEKMIDEYQCGSAIVFGVRKLRKFDTWFKRSSAALYYRVLSLFGVKLISNHADFRLLSRRSVDALKEFPENSLFLRGIIPLIGYRSTVVYYERAERYAGKSKYSLRRMIMLAIDGITSFTAFPLRLIALMGVIVCFASIAMIVWAISIRLFTHLAVPGWASSVIPIYFLGGIQLLSIGVLGEYVAKIYIETKRRPRYFVEENIGL